MVSRNEGLLYDIGNGWSELDAQSSRDRLDGYAVVSGLKVTTDGTDLTLDVSSGSATVGQTSGSVDTVSLGSAGTVTLDAADTDNPRKDTVYIDTSSNLQVEKGIAEQADPSGNTRFNTFEPEPPEPSTEGTILAEVWVASGASSIASADIRDRRQPSEWVGDSVVAKEINTTYYTSNYGTDGAAIQEALDETPSGSWGRVVIDPIESAPYTVADGERLLINDKTVVVIREYIKQAVQSSSDGSVFQNAGWQDETTFDTNIHIIGEGGVIDGDKANQTQTNQDAVNLQAVEFGSVRNLRVRDMLGQGFEIAGSKNITIDGNSISGTDRAGIACAPSKPNNTQQVENLKITNNDVNDSGTAGIIVQAFDNVTVAGNTLDGCHDGVQMDTEDMGYDSKGGTIDGNTIKGGDGNGIWIDSREGGTISHLSITGNTIDTISTTSAWGISVQAGDGSVDTGNVEHLTIGDNAVYSHHVGIYLDGGEYGLIRDYTIDGNTVADTTSVGINAVDATNGSISNNNVSDNDGAGIQIREDLNTVEDVDVADNHVRDNGTYGIRVRGVDNAYVSSNRCTDTGSGSQGTGVETDANCTGAVVILNDLRGSTTPTSLNGTGTITDPVGGGTAEDWNIT